MTAAPADWPRVMSRKPWTGWPSRRPVAHLVAAPGDARALCGRRVAGWCGVLPGVQPAPLCRVCARRAAEQEGGVMLRVFSSGGGVQSIAALVLSAAGVIDYPIHLFCNVGDDSEHPATLRYVREVAVPYAAAHGIAFHELRKIKRDGSAASLYRELLREDISAVRIPVRLGSGAPGNRDCTAAFKIRVVDRWLRQHGATADAPAVTGLGISLDEFHRARSAEDERSPWRLREYPLLTLRIDRADCRRIIAEAGIPVPPKSACWFCPFHTVAQWQQMRHEEPDLFDKAADLEGRIHARLERLGRGAGWFTRKMVPLDQATSPHRQLPLLDEHEDTCKSGYCMT